MTRCSRADGRACFNYPFLTQKERDIETGLDYFLARYYSSTQGRFTGPDEFKGGPDELFEDVDPHDPMLYADIAEPQSLNKYHYCLNNPLRYIDPDGHQTTTADRIRNAAAAVGRTIVATGNGAINAWGQDNGLPIGGGTENKVGRGIGHAAALVQSAGEIIGGVTAIVGGGGEAGITAPACASGVGCVLPAAGLATVVGGAVVTGHGGLVGANTLNNIFSKKTELAKQKKDRTVDGATEQSKGLDKKQEAAVKDARGSGIKQQTVGSKTKTKQNAKNVDREYRDHYNSGKKE